MLIYKSDDVLGLIILLLKKCEENNLTASICFKTEQLCSEFSDKLWQHSDFPHSLFQDQFLEKIPIIIDVKLHSKDVAIIIGDCDLADGFKKVFIINPEKKYENAQYYSYFNKKVSKVS